MRRLSVLFCGLLIAAVGIAIPLAADAADNTGAPAFSSSGTLTFDFVNVGSSASKTVTVTNPNSAPLKISVVDFSGPDTADFTMTANSCTGASLASGAKCAVTVRFAPVLSGTRVAALRFTDNTPCRNYVTVAGSGTGESTAQAQASACEVQVTPPTTVTQTTTTTTTQTTTVAVPTINGQATIKLPTSCVSRRSITFHLAAPARSIFKKVTVKLGSKTFKTLTGKNITSTVSLKGLPRGRFTLTIVGQLNTGKNIKQSRHYVTCVAKKR
jgi:hypothetical protein